MIFFPFSVLGLDIRNDKHFSELLCKEDKDASLEFMELYSDILYKISAKFNNRGTPEDSWEYRKKSGYTINVSDDVADTYVWLFKNVVLKKSCKYLGTEGASFEGYIKTVLNSEWTFIRWRRWKTNDSLIKVPGATGYIPKIIKSMGNPMADIFKLLRQNKSKDVICKKLNLNEIDFTSYYNQIEKSLIETNQLQLIYPPRINSTDANIDDDKNTGFELAGGSNISPELLPEVELLKEWISSVLSSLKNGENKIITLWATGYKGDDILKELHRIPFLEKFSVKNKISSSVDVFNSIEKILTKSLKFTSLEYPELMTEYNLDKSKMKRILKIYFDYFL